MRKWMGLALLVCLVPAATAECEEEPFPTPDHDLLVRIDERVVALRTDVLAMQVRLVNIESSIAELRVMSARQGATYGAIGGVFSAAMSIMIAAAVRSWLEGRKKS